MSKTAKKLPLKKTLVTTFYRMRFVFLSSGVLVVAIIMLMALPKTLHLTQTSVLSANILNAKTFNSSETEVAGLETQVILPTSRGISAPKISAAGSIVIDVDTKTVLFDKDADKRLPIASTTKIMTALVASEYYKPNSVLVVNDRSLVEGSTMGLRLGEQISFRSLLYGMMLNSGNDAAFTIAQNYPGGLAGFVQAMNEKAKALGLSNTHFDNPAGFDAPDHYSSAADLAKIALEAEENIQLSRVVATKEAAVVNIDKSIGHELKNLNVLLNVPGVMGIKTGFTPLAKENFVGLIERENHKVLTVVLGSEDRFGETKNLMEWTYQNFTWVK